MSQMLPEGAEVMRRAACGDVCPAPPPPPPAINTTIRSENKELLRQQLLSASKERLHADHTEPPKQKHQRNRQKNRWKLKFHHQALPQEYLDHYERSLQKAQAKIKPKLDKPKPEPPPDDDASDETFKLWAQRLAAPRPAPHVMTPKPPARADDKKRKHPAIAPSKIVTYDDLPYMGEMTLNDSKPRRGRKPKKADICHLIYENYGTVVPGQPPSERAAAAAGPPPGEARPAARTDLQNRIISSLLERKLSARYPRPDAPPAPAPRTRAGPLHSDEEPLNLCVRDLRDLRLEIRRKFGDIYPERAPVKAEPASPEPPRAEQPNAISVIQLAARRPASSSPRAASPARSEPAPGAAPLVWWPPAVCVHPLALHTQLLYYQRLAAAGAGGVEGSEPAVEVAVDAEVESQRATPASAPGAICTEAAQDDSRSKLVLKQISELLEPAAGAGAGRQRRGGSPGPAPAKRKRSALFVPPAPRRGSTAPAAEVSICKFKFTGGSRPSLQEKKMLSVDAGGNLRYYSGSGARGNKGYDYLQRDALQRQRAAAEAAPPPPPPEDDAAKKKRKSRKSVARERLERTFKEKGFLIQTQQRQSAEGATYCKFRQLRKFTRYLFRSWKDYLPGDLAPGAPGAGGPAPPSPPAADGAAAGDWG